MAIEIKPDDLFPLRNIENTVRNHHTDERQRMALEGLERVALKAVKKGRIEETMASLRKMMMPEEQRVKEMAESNKAMEPEAE
jgi:hypothetical protein